MKITCSRDDLLAACQALAPATAAATTIPALRHLKAAARGDTLVLVAYDTSQGIGIRYEVPGVTVHRPGACILPKEQLLQILQQNADPMVHVDATRPGAVAVGCNGNEYELPLMDPGEFPDFPELEGDTGAFELGADVLRHMIARTAFAADKKDTTVNFALQGVLWRVEDQALTLVATDTKRLALDVGGLSSPPDVLPSGARIVPLKAVALLARLLDDDGRVVRCVVRENDALFRTERATVYTALLQGRFPPYRELLDRAGAEARHHLALPVAELLARVRQAAITADEESRRVDVTFEPGTLALTARGAERGASAVRMPLPGYTGAPVRTAFDPAYLTEFLRALGDASEVTVDLAGGDRPALFRCGPATYLVQPLTG